MQIIELIDIYKALIPIFQKAIDEKWPYYKLHNNQLHCGICRAAEYHTDMGSVREVFSSYYKNITDIYGLIHDSPEGFNTTKQNIKALQFRIQFMKSEITDLKKLIKNGYTHV